MPKFVWSRQAVENARDLGLSPQLLDIQKKFEAYAFRAAPPDFGHGVHYDNAVRLWFVVTMKVGERELPQYVDDVEDDGPPNTIVIYLTKVTERQRRRLRPDKSIVGVVDRVCELMFTP